MADLMVGGIGTDPISNLMGTAQTTAKNEEAEPVFASMLNSLNSTNSQPQIAKVNVAENFETPNQSYTSDNYRNKLVKETATKTEDNINPESVEKLQKYNDKIKEAVMEEYDLTEEELDSVMEELGLTYIQLLDPKNLVALSVEITGADNAMDLLANEGFNDLFQIMQDMAVDLTQELNITPEMLDEFAGMLANDNELPNSGELIQAENVNPNEELINDNMTNESEVEAIDGLATKVEEVVTKGIQNGTVEVNITKSDNTEEAVENDGENEQSILNNGLSKEVEGTNEESAEFGQSNSGSEKKLSQSSNSKQQFEVDNSTSVTGNSFSRFMEGIEEMNMSPVESFSQVDTDSIIRQINDFMKLNISNVETSLEMQLNPASLGKIALNVSVRDGMVTAQLAVENEAVKQALESQMVIVRENMNNQGLKVEAVEVTIASHEFEQNLENGFTGERNNNPENPQQGQRRILASDLTSMDELSQEDQLAAKIMVQNGNRMDISA